MARRYTGAHLRAAQAIIDDLRCDAGASSVDIAESVGHAFGLWSFPAQDDVDFALPTYDAGFYDEWLGAIRAERS